jgi:hypothetical protein
MQKLRRTGHAAPSLQKLRFLQRPQSHKIKTAELFMDNQSMDDQIKDNHIPTSRLPSRLIVSGGLLFLLGFIYYGLAAWSSSTALYGLAACFAGFVIVLIGLYLKASKRKLFVSVLLWIILGIVLLWAWAYYRRQQLNAAADRQYYESNNIKR